MAVAIDVKDLTKVYRRRSGGTPAVDHLTFQVNKGEIFGFIGPNGAGKTTTIKMLLGLLFPTSGSAQVDGKPIGDIEVKQTISYLPESPYFYEHMTGREVLDFYGRLFKMDTATRKERIEKLLADVNMTQDAGRTLREYSKGMLQRIGIAQALINEPKILFLDEPTSGLDPVAHKDIRDVILNLKKQGKTVFLSSHQLSDIESVCDRVAMIKRGKLVRLGTMDDLLHAGRTVITLCKVDPKLLESVKGLIESSNVDGENLVLYTDSEENVYKILDAARGKSVLISVVPQRQTLEDMFVEIVREVRQ